MSLYEFYKSVYIYVMNIISIIVIHLDIYIFIDYRRYIKDIYWICSIRYLIGNDNTLALARF